MGTELPGFPVLAGFEAPLEMLAACHGRIRTQCSTLLRLRAHVATHGTDAAARDAARGVIRYFDKASHDHHEDEEQDLFPALLEPMADSHPVGIRELIASLTNEHRELARLWDAVRAWLVAIEAGDITPPAPGEIDSLVGLYERHTTREEQELLPMAARLLGTRELDRIGQAMRLRRGITSY